MLLLLISESPRMLIKQGRHDAALSVLSKIYSKATPGEVLAKKMVLQANIKQSLRIFEETTFRDRVESIYRVGANRRAMILAAGLQALQQLCGFNSLSELAISALMSESQGFSRSLSYHQCITPGETDRFTRFRRRS